MQTSENLPAVRHEEKMAMAQLDEMEQILAKTTDATELVKARNTIAPVMSYLKQIKATRGVLVKAAELKLKIERKIGRWLIENTHATNGSNGVVVGGLSHRKGGRDSMTVQEAEKTLGVTKAQQSNFVTFAVIDDNAVGGYFDIERRSNRIPSGQRFYSFARKNLQGGGRALRHTGKQKNLPDGIIKIKDKTDSQIRIEMDGMSNLRIYVALTGDYACGDTLAMEQVAKTLCSTYNSCINKRDRDVKFGATS